MANKLISIEEAVDHVQDGMTIGIGGWGSRRKPMAFVRGLIRKGVKDLTIVSYGGPDVGLLCATGQARKVIYGFVSLDSIPLEAHFRKARQAGAIEAVSLDEGMFRLGLTAAAWRLPFLPTRAGLGTDVFKNVPALKTVTSPYVGEPLTRGALDGDPEELVAVPALRTDVAFIHMNRADAHGNGQYLGRDPYMDELFCMGSDKAFMSAERIVDTNKLLDEGTFHTLRINRMMVQGVTLAPGGAHFTQCPPDYGRDEAFQKEYAATAKDPDAWAAFKAKYLDVSEAEYQKAVAK